jgi:protocatechuate 3,4-dioxygenase beta subunit
MIDQNKELDRRSFLLRLSATAVTLPIVGLATLELTNYTNILALSEGESLSPGSWKTSLCSNKEPGLPLIVSGTIFAPDGRTPLQGATLFVYQTDATGVYTPEAGSKDNRTTRLHGQMITDASGRYEFRTIKPAPYPNSRIASHIHAHLAGPGYPEYWIDEYLFADDKFVDAGVRKNQSDKGRFSCVLNLTKGSDGVLRGARDIQIEKCSSRCTAK